jgi:hypothetical protein
MRGTPWLRFALMGCALALVAVPIWLLTRSEGSPQPAVPATAPPTVERDLTLEIESVPAAQSIGISYLGRELIPSNPPGGTYSGKIRLPATSPADLVVMARWADTPMAALRVRVSDVDGPVAEASYWGTDRVEDVLTIPQARE